MPGTYSSLTWTRFWIAIPQRIIEPMISVVFPHSWQLPEWFWVLIEYRSPLEIRDACTTLVASVLTVTKVTLAGSWYWRSSVSTGIWTLGRLFNLLLMWTSSSSTWKREKKQYAVKVTTGQLDNWRNWSRLDGESDVIVDRKISAQLMILSQKR